MSEAVWKSREERLREGRASISHAETEPPHFIQASWWPRRILMTEMGNGPSISQVAGRYDFLASELSD